MDGAQLCRPDDLGLRVDDRPDTHEGKECVDLAAALRTGAIADPAAVRAFSPASSQAGFMRGAREALLSADCGASCCRYCQTSQHPGNANRNERRKNHPQPSRLTASAEGRPENTRPSAS